MGGTRGVALAMAAAGTSKRRLSTSEPKESLTKSLEKFKSFQSGMSIGFGYRLGQMISSGTQGDVFICASATAGGVVRHLAAKRVRPGNPSITRHLLQEVAAIFHARGAHVEESGDPSSPGHPNIVGYLDWFAGPNGAEREVYIAMERCEFALSDLVFTTNQMRAHCERFHSDAKKSASSSGRTVAPLDPTLYRVTEREVVKIMQSMLLALAFLNRSGLVHRDIKADNILWLSGGQREGAYKLTDFGTAAFFREGEPARKEADCGTLWTMAPEMLAGRAHGHNCDSWSLGVVLFQLASLDYPFSSKELLAYRHSPEAISEGSFWPFVLNGGGGSSGSTSRAGPAAAKSQGAKAVAPPRPTPGRTSVSSTSSSSSAKAASSPAPASGTGRSPGWHKARKAAGGQGKGRGMSHRTASAPGALPTVADARAQDALAEEAAVGAGGDCEQKSGMSSSVAALPPLSPGTTTSPAPSADTSPRRDDIARRRAFLRKRCAFRWCYSEGVLASILEDMLEEAPAERPTAAGLLARPRVQDLVERCLSSPPTTLVTELPAEVGSIECDDAAGRAAAFNKIASEFMKQVTGESFRMSMVAKHRLAKQQAAADANGDGQA